MDLIYRFLYKLQCKEHCMSPAMRAKGKSQNQKIMEAANFKAESSHIKSM